MKKSSTSANLLYRPKLARPLSIQKLIQPSSIPCKQNETSTLNNQMIRIRSSQKLLSRYPSTTSIQQKKTYIQPNRWLVKAKGSTQQQICSNKQIPKIFKRRRSVFPQSQKHIQIQGIKPIAKRNNETLKQSKIQRKLIIRNPFQKRELEMQFLQLTKCDQSAIAHHSQIAEDISQIKNIMTTIDSQQFV